MKRSDFFKLIGLSVLFPKIIGGTAAGRVDDVVSVNLDNLPKSKYRGITDILAELGLYEPTGSVKPYEVETVNGVDVVHENRLQIFRITHFSPAADGINEDEAQRRFETMKRWVDTTMLHGQKAVVFFADNDLVGKENGGIQTMAGLDSFIKEKGILLEAQDYGLPLFRQIVDLLNHVKSPSRYLMACQRDEFDKIMGSFKNLGASNIKGSGNTEYNTITYGGITFLITPIDNCEHAASYLIPLSKVKLKNGNLKNRFSARYSPNPSSGIEKINDIWFQWEHGNKDEIHREYYTCQCPLVIGTEYFMKINHNPQQ